MIKMGVSPSRSVGFPAGTLKSPYTKNDLTRYNGPNWIAYVRKLNAANC
jgi:hypothetical protein